MPLTPLENALLCTGAGAVGLATYFYKKKRTVPFKAAYFAAWPLLGSAIILIGTPSYEGMEKTLKKNGIATDAGLTEAQERSRAQMESLRRAAGK